MLSIKNIVVFPAQLFMFIIQFFFNCSVHNCLFNWSQNYPSERLDHTSGNSDKIPENHPSFDAEEDDGGLNAGSRSKDTIYLIGVRQSNGEKDVAAPKIALPFEILEREAVESAASDDDHDRTNAEDVRVEKNEKNNGHKPIGLSTEAVIKVSNRCQQIS